MSHTTYFVSIGQMLISRQHLISAREHILNQAIISDGNKTQLRETLSEWEAGARAVYRKYLINFFIFK